MNVEEARQELIDSIKAEWELQDRWYALQIKAVDGLTKELLGDEGNPVLKESLETLRLMDVAEELVADATEKFHEALRDS